MDRVYETKWFFPPKIGVYYSIYPFMGGGAGLLFNLVPVDDDLDDSVPNLKDKRKQHTKMSPILEFYKKKVSV